MENTENLNELFYGKEVSEKIEKLNEGLLKIEEENSEYFENRVTEKNIKDRLHNHYITIIDNQGIKFSFIDESDLDNRIKNSCHKLFNDIFNPEVSN